MMRVVRGSSIDCAPLSDDWLAVHAGFSSEAARVFKPLVVAAAALIEEHTELALLSQRVTVEIDEWPSGQKSIRLPIGPVTQDRFLVLVGGVESDFFVLHPGLRPSLEALIHPLNLEGDVAITYTAGWSCPSEIPPNLATAVFEQAFSMWDALGIGRHAESPLVRHVATALDQYRGATN